MTLSLQPRSEGFEPLGRWPLPLRPPFMRGDIYAALRRDIASYVIEDISGRSYLIAGHRGSGKTAVTMTVVKDLRRDLLVGSVQIDPDAEPTIRRLQRPLLVKLHGPSLMEISSAAVDGTKSTKPDPAESAQPADPPLGTAAAEPEAVGKPSKPPPVAAEAHTALKQITIGLYRALAAETALGARAHAEEREADLGPRGVELAAQLALDLDSGVEPGALRAYWQRLGRLRLGVLWPRLADDALEERGMTDQGLREIMALATAAQAYRVCSGAVVYSRSEKLNHTGSDEIKQSQSWDAKTLVSLIGALGAGALAGAAVLTHAPWPSIGVGALVWLAGSLSVTWTAARKQERQQAADYSFIRDSSLQTLDRELPLMIQRIRDAGLAPIFVIDELDKLGDPDETIAQIIARLKHIIVDYGFFCFLTDRDYYDHIKSKLRDGAFPVEHTFFSELRLISYRPRELADYIRSLLISDQGDDEEQLEREIFTYWVLHGAKLNFTDVNRELRGAVEGDGVLTLQATALRGRPDVAFAVSIQLAIEEVLSRPEIAARAGDDAAFAQLALDAVYAVSRRWEASEKEYDADPAKLQTYLKSRLKALDGAGGVQVGDLEILEATVAALVGYLEDFASLARAVAARPGPLQAQLAQYIPVSTTPGLLVHRARRSKKYGFTHDQYGRELLDTAPLDADEAAELLRLLSALEQLLQGLGVTYDALMAASLIPTGSLWSALLDARQRVVVWQEKSGDEQAARAGLAELRRLRATLNAVGPIITTGLALCEHLVHDGRATMADALKVLGRFPVLNQNKQAWAWTYAAWRKDFPGYPDLNRPIAVKGDPDELLKVLEQHRQSMIRIQKERRAPFRLADLLPSWRERFQDFFEGRPANPRGLVYEDLLGAARGVAPLKWLRPDLSHLSAAEWSALCLWALPDSGSAEEAPRWCVVAALRGLGFESRLLETLARAPSPGGGEAPEPEQRLALDLAAKAPKGARGLLVRRLDDDEGFAFASPRSGPMLFVRRSEFTTYGVGLSWLRSFDAFAGVIDEVEIEDQERS